MAQWELKHYWVDVTLKEKEVFGNKMSGVSYWVWCVYVGWFFSDGFCDKRGKLVVFSKKLGWCTK